MSTACTVHILYCMLPNIGRMCRRFEICPTNLEHWLEMVGFGSVTGGNTGGKRAKTKFVVDLLYLSVKGAQLHGKL